MTRLHSRYGWLLYANPELSDGMVVSGDVLSFELSAEQSYGRMAFTVRCELLPGAELRHSVNGASLEQMMWEALQHWPEPGVRDGRRWPAEMEAALELARRHPDEYGDLVTKNRRRSIPLRLTWKPDSADQLGIPGT
jgi:hypothetical protein